MKSRNCISKDIDTQGGPKTGTLFCTPYLRQILTDLQTNFTD